MGALHVPLSTSPAVVEGRPALGATAPPSPHAHPESLGKCLIVDEPQFHTCGILLPTSSPCEEEVYWPSLENSKGHGSLVSVLLPPSPEWQGLGDVQGTG